MSSLIPLVDLSSSLFKKIRMKWFKRNEAQVVRREADWLSERPESWYKGPLIFPSFPEEGVEASALLQFDESMEPEEVYSD